MELSESPAAPANDTSVWSIGGFLAWTAPLLQYRYLVEHLAWGPVSQGLMGPLVIVEPEIGPSSLRASLA